MNKSTVVIRDVNRDNCQDFTQEYLDIQLGHMPIHLKRDIWPDKFAQLNVAQILRIKKIADYDSIPVIVALLPDENQINPHLQNVLLNEEDLNRCDFDMPQSVLIEMLTENHIQVINLLPNFQEDDRCLHMNDGHWTPEGHELAATVIYEKLINNKMLTNLIK
jgi:hypothetical protein